MSTLAIAGLLALAALAGAVLGASAVVAYRRLWPSHDPTVAVLREQLEVEQTRRRMAEHRLAFWIGLRQTTIITVDRRTDAG